MFSQNKTAILLERNIRQQLILDSGKFEPQIKAIFKKLETISRVSIIYEDQFANEHSSFFNCFFCKKSFGKAISIVYHFLFFHRNMKFTFKLEASNSHKNTFTLSIKSEKKPFNVASPSSFSFYNKPNKSNKGIRYEAKLMVQKLIKKGFILIFK